MSDPFDYEDDLDEDVFPDISAITITFNEEDGIPNADLGTTNPWVAVTILRLVVQALEVTLVPPTIRYDDHVIFEAITRDD